MKLRPISVLPTLLLLMASFCVVPGALAQDEDGHEGEAIAFFNQGQDAHEKGDLKTAIGLYEKAIKLLPEFPEAELLGMSCVYSHRPRLKVRKEPYEMPERIHSAAAASFRSTRENRDHSACGDGGNLRGH